MYTTLCVGNIGRMPLDKTKEIASAVPHTIAQFIYDNLKKLILDGELKPNQRITQKEIEDRFNVSSSPVREAIHRICAEQLLVRSERKYVLVQLISPEELKQLFEVVRILDSIAYSRSVLTMTDDDLNDLKRLTKELSNFYEKNDVINFIKTNMAIHNRIWQNCGNRFLYEALNQLAEKVEIYIVREDYVFFRRPGALKSSYKEHLQITKAIEDRDVKALSKIMQTHWGQELFGKGDIDKKMSPLEKAPTDWISGRK